MSADFDAIRERYRGFALHQAHGVSSKYEELALAIADSDELLGFVAGLPAQKQQPNLVLASARWVAGLAEDGLTFREQLHEHGDRIRETIMERGTQTNEARRCATLLPVLARLPEPLALLEVGASAGLCLLPDRYGYDYGEVTIDAPTSESLVLPCAVSPGTTLPDRNVRVAWRRGLDIHPIDVRDPDQTAWLENLVWPGQEERLSTLRGALHIARVDPPVIEQGDLVTGLRDAAGSAPPDATLVVFHSAVLNYVEPAAREAFRREVEEVGAVWVSNEGESVFPDVTQRAQGRSRPDRFILAVDGEPVALTGLHGQTFEWL